MASFQEVQKKMEAIGIGGGGVVPRVKRLINQLDVYLDERQHEGTLHLGLTTRERGES